MKERVELPKLRRTTNQPHRHVLTAPVVISGVSGVSGASVAWVAWVVLMAWFVLRVCECGQPKDTNDWARKTQRNSCK